MPTLHPDFLEPLWVAFSAVLPEHVDTHPYGGHNPRTDDRLIFERLLEVVINGLSYEKAGVKRASATTIRRRRNEWIEAGVFAGLKNDALRAYDKALGLDFTNISIDGCITKAPNGGELAGPSPVDRRKGGVKRHLLVEGNGIPIYTVVVPANVNDCVLLSDTLDGLDACEDLLPEPGDITVHLDAGYDYPKTLQTVYDRGYNCVVSKRGTPLQAGRRWKVEGAHAWFNHFKGIKTCNERKLTVYAAWVQFAAAIIVVKKILTEGWTRYRWPGRPKRFKRAWGRDIPRRVKRKQRDMEAARAARSEDT